MTYLVVNNVVKSFGGVKALDSVSFSVEKGQVLGLIGPNGSGKSTLFNSLTNIFSKDSGVITLENVDISNLKPHEIARMGVIRTFQDAKPIPQLPVWENIDLAYDYTNKLSLFNVFFSRRKLRSQQSAHMDSIKELLDGVDIPEKFGITAGELSYGQGKLLEMLKVQAYESKLVLLDEPFSGLFPEMIKVIKRIIKDLVKQGKTIVLVEHNMKLIEEICDKVVVLDAGRVVAEGTFKQVTKDPVVIDCYLGG